MMAEQPKRILEINNNNEPLNLPIVKFPPYTLRAQLIEKDPVVWLHILETYVHYCQWLMAGDNNLGHGSNISMIDQLDETTLDHLRIFLRSYLHEMSLEAGKLVSLGYNQDVKEQLQLLRSWIFYIIKSCGLIYLQIFGETLWDLVKLYVINNPKTVQDLILGELVPTVNVQRAQINRIPQLQQSLKLLIESNKFDRTDLKALQALLSYHENTTTTTFNNNNSNGSNNKTKTTNTKEEWFSEKYLTPNWIENLELWWSKGKGRFNELSRQLCVTLLLSVRVPQLVKFLTEDLEITNSDTLLYYPLLGSILTNDNFLNKRKDIINYLPFLTLSSIEVDFNDSQNTLSDQTNLASINEPNNEDISYLQELFPDLTRKQAILLLTNYDNNLKLITNELFENPTLIKTLEAQETRTSKFLSKIDNIDDDKQIEKPLVLMKRKDESKNIIKHVPDEINNKILTRTLKLLYQDDEDERDDTYDEVEVETNRINGSTQRIGIGKDDSTFIFEDENNPDNTSNDNSTLEDSFDKNEAYLWDLLKQDKTLFERSKRGSNIRKKIKNQTNWSDEQIEGWARMLERSPQRARILEERYMFHGNIRTGKTSYVKNRDENKDTNKNSSISNKYNESYGSKPSNNPKLNKKKYQRGPKKTDTSKVTNKNRDIVKGNSNKNDEDDKKHKNKSTKNKSTNNKKA
ncbi:Cue3p PWA37_002096 [Arxiozyma heterogenica]|uniref:Cue3p n=1 Tax=Arxiozyma heterogenica TaxID=278026 RepID=UPI002F22CB6C